MKVLVTGATGLIGTAVVARMISKGHTIKGIARNTRRHVRRLPQVQWISLDMARTISPKAWMPLLAGIDAVVNCAGVLQDGPEDSVQGVHAQGAAALFQACENAGIRRVVQLSAIGLDRETPTSFSRTKLQGDAALMARNLDWVILRPSVVVGRPAYGGSALFRGLAALPMLPVMPDTGPLQIVQLDEVVETVLFFLRAEAPTRVTLELAGPERLSFVEVVQHYRRWLGWDEARLWRVPNWMAGWSYRLGDFAGLLGWRPPIRSTAGREISRGAIGEPGEWMRLTGIKARSLSEALAAEPASVQERWFAGVYLLKPLLLTVLSLFWVGTGILSLWPGYPAGVALIEDSGAGTFARPMVAVGAIADILIGIAIAVRRTSWLGLYAALAVSIFYLVAGTILLPRLWTDPLGPLMKIWPILVLNLMALATLEDR